MRSMKQNLMALVILVFLVANSSIALAGSPPCGWRQTFGEEFNGRAVDTTKWNTTFPWGRRTTPSNNELQWYVDNAFEFTGNTVRIRADKKTVNDYKYTSGMLASWNKFSQTYGYFEMRAKLPKGKGYWPAFWLLPASGKWPPEVDIMEALGHMPTKVYMTSHASINGVMKQVGGNYIGPDFSKGFHTFGVHWQPNLLVYYIDGVERFRTQTNVPNEPMYLIANLAVGGKWPGNPDSSTVFPNHLEIDYIRVYQEDK